MKKNIILVLLFAGILFVNAGFHKADQKSGILKVHFLDVGQGDAIFIQAPNGFDMLIDGGPSSAVLYELGKVMPFWDFTIDVVIATHPHADHISGLVDVMEKYNVVQAYSSVNNYYNNNFHELQRIINLNEIPVEHVLEYQKIQIDENIFIEFLMPPNYENEYNLKKYTDNINNASIVVKLTYDDSTYLFTGDAEKDVEPMLVEEYDLDVDVLKVGHHGSKTSTTYGLLAEATPDYSVILAGKDNRFGHPHQQIIDRLGEFDTKVLRTDQDGLISLYSDGKTIWQDESLDFSKIYAIIKANLEFITN